jgi:gamma-glutamylaminecyclotransferase
VQKVFVFGTLKEGFPNFKTNKGIRFRGQFETKERYPLYLVGERFSPWLVLQPGDGFPIKGQIFEVSDEALAEMDVLERINEPDGYRRTTVQVTCLESGEQLSAFVYGKPPEMVATAHIKAELTGEYSLKHAELYRNRQSGQGV